MASKDPAAKGGKVRSHRFPAANTALPFVNQDHEQLRIWGATEPMDWWTVVNRCRALENTAFVVAANQGASLRHYPPYSWPGGSMVVDFDGRILAQASAGPGERIVVAPIDVSALRHERATRRGHHTLAHLRSEAYPVYSTHRYSPGGERAGAGPLSYEGNLRLIDEAKKKL